MVDKVWLPQRWDVGLWDQAVWDGQVGFNAAQGTIRVLPRTANLVFGHRLSCQTAHIVVNGRAAGLYAGVSLPVGTGHIIVAGNPAGVTFSVHHTLRCNRGRILVNPIGAQVTLTAFLQPGLFTFGTPIMIPNRW